MQPSGNAATRRRERVFTPPLSEAPKAPARVFTVAPEAMYLAVSVAFVATLVHLDLASLEGLLQFGDSTSNLLALQGLLQTGLPYVQPSILTANYEPGVFHLLYWDYLPELLLRLPFYAVGRGSETWIPWSAVTYFYAGVAFLTYLAAKRRAPFPDAGLTVAIGIAFFATTAYFSWSFWFCRYYTFVFMGAAVAHLLCLSYDKERRNLAYLSLTPITALLPTIFNASALPLFMYWTLVVLYRNWDNRRFRLAAIGTGGLVLAFFLYRYSYLLVLNEYMIPHIKGFLIRMMGPKWGLPLFAALFTFAWKRRRFATPFERAAILHGFGAFALGALAMSVFSGGRYHVSARHSLYLHPVWCFAMGGVLSVVFRPYLERLRAPLPRLFAVAVLVIGLPLAQRAWLNDVEDVRHAYGFDPVTPTETRSIAATLRAAPDVMIFSGETQFFHVNYPDTRAFLLHNHPAPELIPRLRPSQEIDLLFRDSSDRVRNIYGEFLAGTTTTFCQALRSNPGGKSRFFRPGFFRISPQLRSRLDRNGHLYTDLPIPNALLLADVCGVSRS